MPQTLVEKLLARAAGCSTLQAGDIITVPADRLMINDYIGSLIFTKLNDLHVERIVRPESVLLAIDHNMPSFTVEAADRLVMFRKMAEKYGISHFAKVGFHGISHQMMVEDFVQPLELAFGTDSHATMYAGLGAFSCGITTSDAIGLLMLGKVWIKVPETVRITVSGTLPPAVTAKDLSLKILTLLPEEQFAYKAVEVVGPAIEEMSVEGRLVIANMVAETGAKCAVFEADEKAYTFVHRPAGERLRSDEGAAFCADFTIDAGALAPLVSCPHKVTNICPVRDVEGKHVDQVFIGSCTNGRLEDLMQAAEVLRGHTVADGTRLLVTPASQTVLQQASANGTLDVLIQAGAVIQPASCSSCFGNGPGLIGCGERCMSTTNRNFKGRMGSPDAEIYLGSAYTAAAAAVTGYITDPAPLLRHEKEAP